MAQAADSTSDSAYHPVTPVRILDTRSGSQTSNGTLKLDVEGSIATFGADGTVTNQEVVPASASAVAINLTITEGAKKDGYGFVTVFPCTEETDTPPNASSINFENKVDIANALNVTTSSSGEICLYVYGTAHLIVDVAGYYDESRLDAIEADYIDNDAEYTISFPIHRDTYNLLYSGTIGPDDTKMELKLENGVGGVGFDIPGYVSYFGQALKAYRLKSLSICIPANGNTDGGYISDLQIHKGGSTTELSDFAARASTVWTTSANCEVWEIPATDRTTASTTYRAAIVISDTSGINGDVRISQVIATFEPYTSLNLLVPLIPLLPFESE